MVATYDHDYYNCGYTTQSGWWYNYYYYRCAYANVNGRHEMSGLPGIEGIQQMLTWDSGNGPEVYTNSEIKIRSKTCNLSC